MAVCIICKRSGDECLLFEGIYKGEIKNVCKKCAWLENIPVIKKPTEEQLLEAEKRYTVRERMERMSKPSKKTQLNKEQGMAYKNIKHLRYPEKRQEHEKLVRNYYWTLQTTRRKRRLSINQLSALTKIPPEVLKSIEYGQLPENFESFMKILENVLRIKLFKTATPSQDSSIASKENQKQIEKEILEQTRRKIEQERKDEKKEKDKKEIIKKIISGNVDFSKRKNLDNITINDLIDLKRKREKEEMFGDDLELEDLGEE